MSRDLSVSMILRLAVEGQAAMNGLADELTKLGRLSDDLGKTSGDTSASRWAAEKMAVGEVVGAVEGLQTATAMLANGGAIEAATAKWKDEEGAVGGVLAAVEKLDGALGSQGGAIDAAIGKLHEESAAVDGLAAKMRELGTASEQAGAGGGGGAGTASGGGRWIKGRWVSGGPEAEAAAEEAPDERQPFTYRRAPAGGMTAAEYFAQREAEANKGAGGGGIVDSLISFAEFGLGLKMLKGTYHQAAEAQGRTASMIAAGIPGDEIGEINAAASQLSLSKRVFSRNELADVLKDARTVLGSTGHAIEAGSDIADLATIAEAQRPGHGLEGVQTLLKGIETSGRTRSPQEFHDIVQSIAKVTNVMGKTIDFSAWGQFFKYAGTAGQHMSPEFIEQKLPHLIQELGGASTGTMFQTLERALIGGRMDKGAVETMREYGLLDESKVHETKHGMKLDPGALQHGDEAMSDLSNFVLKRIKPALDAKGLSETEQLATLEKMFSARLGARAVSILLNQDPIIQKDAAQIRAAQGTEAAPMLATTDPHLVNRSLGAQGANLETSAGAPIIGPITSGTNLLTSTIGNVTQMLDRIPGAATGLEAAMIAGTGYLGWKTWENGVWNTAKSALRMPGEAASGLVNGIKEGVRQALAERTEASNPLKTTVDPAGPTIDGVASRVGTVSDAAARMSTRLATLGMLVAWAQQHDRGVPDRDLNAILHGRRPTASAHPPPSPGAYPLTSEEVSADLPGIRHKGRRFAAEFGSDPEAVRGRAMIAHEPAPGGIGMAPVGAIDGVLGKLDAELGRLIAAQAANRPQTMPTAAATPPPPSVVNNDNKRFVSAPITVNAPVTVNATITGTPQAVGAAVATGIAGAVAKGAAAFHDGTETK